MERLETLRRRIRNLDAALLALAAERTELAREIGSEKRRAGIPLRDYEVEKRVLERAAATATELGLDRELSRALVTELIGEACRVQEIDTHAAFAGDAESVLVVGGAGRMGRWLVGFLASQGHQVRIHDPAAAPGDVDSVRTLEEGLVDSSLVFVATPLERVAASLDAISETGFRGTLCDLASLKEHLRPALGRARRRGVEVTSIHPMFGPAVRTLAGRVIVHCDCGSAVATERVARLFRDTAATLVPLSIERHDRIAAYVLGLSHFVSLAFASALAGAGIERAELLEVGSTTFHAQIATARSVVGEDPGLYYAIQKLNRYSPGVWDGFLRASNELAAAVGRGDAAAFESAMRAGSDWIGEAPSEEGTPRSSRPGRA